MCPRAAESVPVLDVKTPDCSWIVREEAVIDNLAIKQTKLWYIIEFRKPECLGSRSQLSFLAPPRRLCPHLPRTMTKNKSSMSERISLNLLSS